ncbi:hypothetical protein DPMN_088111 [Dreissena polymorpha]|uniref:Uncharacterized protein n=1 Tax=Dreissena polymorpha TaxID=45954 RepID=A0A9D4QW43_DREPO|nr:hypothetical protein DPMN_088111 [Dreissena polymorpha]
MNSEHPGDHVFSKDRIHFRTHPNIIKTNIVTKFQNIEQKMKDAPPPGGHVFQPTVTIFKLVRDIIGTILVTKVLTRKNAPHTDIMRTNVLTKFHDDRTINVASRVLTRFYYNHIRKNVPPLGSHVFQANVTIFELIQDIIEFNLLTKFQKDWTINVASKVLTRQM